MARKFGGHRTWDPGVGWLYQYRTKHGKIKRGHSKKRWIQKTIKNPGSLRRWAKKHRFLNKDNTINLRKAKAYAVRHNNKKRIKQIILAMTLRKLRK